MASTSGNIAGSSEASSNIDWINIVVLMLSTLSVGGIISLYVMGLAWLNLKDSNSDPMDRAARVAAEDLLQISVVSGTFGNVGLADFYDDEAARGAGGAAGEVRSVNTIAAQIRTTLGLAKKYKLGAMANLARTDLKELLDLKAELRNQMTGAVQTDGTGKIYEHVKRILTSRSRGSQHLENLQIKLGTSADRMQIAAIEANEDDPEEFKANGRLRTLIPLTVPLSDQKIYLDQQVKKVAIVDVRQFVADQKNTLPTTIFIQADFISPGRDGHAALKTRRQICVIAGADFANQNESTTQADGCLAISFPQGRPRGFDSLEAILTAGNFNSAGQWLQALEGGVPGSGHLSPPAVPVGQAMNGADSLSIALYHWLRGQSHATSPKHLEALLKTRWTMPNPPRPKGESNPSPGKNVPGLMNSDYDEATGAEITGESSSLADIAQDNSGLVRESGARQFALLYQTRPAEVGQKALFNAFQALPLKFAPSTLPLVIDAEGRANLPGNKGFDQALAGDLLNSIYATNLAAQDTLATAKLVQTGAMRAYRSSKERLFLAQTDLESLSNRLKNETAEAAKKAIGNEIDWRNNRITFEINEQKKQLKVYSLAASAAANARSVATQSFECGSKLFQLARGGINRVQNLESGPAFLLGRRFIFRPLVESLSERDIFDAAAATFDTHGASEGKTSSTTGGGDKNRAWLSHGLRIFGRVKNMTTMADTKIQVDGQSLSDLAAQRAPVAHAEPCVIVYTPQQLTGAATMLYFKDYPFRGLNLPERQLFYYNQNGYQSEVQSAGAVAWSVMVRDLVAFKGFTAGHQHLGLPLAPTAGGWFKKALNYQASNKGENNLPPDQALTAATSEAGLASQSAQASGGLAVEWQLRSPLMLFNDNPEKASESLLKGTTLSDPESGQRVPQIPPVGPEQM